MNGGIKLHSSLRKERCRWRQLYARALLLRLSSRQHYILFQMCLSWLAEAFRIFNFSSTLLDSSQCHSSELDCMLSNSEEWLSWDRFGAVWNSLHLLHSYDPSTLEESIPNYEMLRRKLRGSYKFHGRPIVVEGGMFGIDLLRVRGLRRGAIGLFMFRIVLNLSLVLLPLLVIRQTLQKRLVSHSENTTQHNLWILDSVLQSIRERLFKFKE